MMEGWSNYVGRKVFILLKNKRNYTGKVIEIISDPNLTWIVIKDKFDKRITFSTEEIEVLQEEGE